jgi:3-deoxy-D-manno-octulosonic-acid transferase
MILVNGRISPGSFAGWRRAPSVIAAVLACFDLCLGQTEGDAERLRQLGAHRHVCLGNLKYASPALPADAAELDALRHALDGRPRWLAASTHAGEEEIAAEVHARLEPEFPALLTLIAPRHPSRGDDIQKRLDALGLNVARRAAGEPIGPDTQIYLADTLGELGTFYRLSGIAFVGKSLAGQGGQNPLEPLRLDCVVLHGPHMTNFADIARRLDDAGAAIEVADAGELGDRLRALLCDPAERDRRAAIGRDLADTEAGVLTLVAEEVGKFLDGVTPPREEAPPAAANARA